MMSSPSADADHDPLLSKFEESETLFQWHGDTFEIPNGAMHLASSRTAVIKRFATATMCTRFQFHLEVDEPMILRWLKVPENRHEIASLHGDIDPDEIHTQTAQHIKRLHELSDHVFSQFIKLFGVEKTRLRLASR